MTDWTELQPGRWFPMTQGCETFTSTPDADVGYASSSVRTMHAVDVRIDEPLPEGWLAYELLAGMQISDRRFVPTRFYEYDPENDGAMEFARRVAEDRGARLAERKQAPDALIGTPVKVHPPPNSRILLA